MDLSGGPDISAGMVETLTRPTNGPRPRMQSPAGVCRGGTGRGEPGRRAHPYHEGRSGACVGPIGFRQVVPLRESARRRGAQRHGRDQAGAGTGLATPLGDRHPPHAHDHGLHRADAATPDARGRSPLRVVAPVVRHRVGGGGRVGGGRLGLERHGSTRPPVGGPHRRRSRGPEGIAQHGDVRHGAGRPVVEGGGRERRGGGQDGARGRFPADQRAATVAGAAGVGPRAGVGRRVHDAHGPAWRPRRAGGQGAETPGRGRGEGRP